MQGIIETREMSGFPVSIGTGLALESLFPPVMDVIDQERIVPKIKDLNRYQAVIFNVATLVRNMISSIPSEFVRRYRKDDFLKTLIDEMEFITQFAYSQNTQVGFYILEHRKLTKENQDRLKIPTSEKMIYEDSIMRYCLEEIVKQRGIPPVNVFRDEIKISIFSSILLLTHIPADLLSYKNFAVMDLLESHTGVVKSRKDFNSKYFKVPGQDMSAVPFFEEGLLVFGDRVMFKPRGLKDRVYFYDYLMKKRLNPMSSGIGIRLSDALPRDKK